KFDDALGFGTKQQIRQMSRAETLSGAIDRRKRVLRRDRSVPAPDGGATIVAISAGWMVAFSEIAEQDLPPATNRFGITEQRLDLLALDTALRIGDLAAVEQPEKVRNIGHAIGQPGVGREPVAPGAAGLLVIGFEVLRRVEMGDKADIWLVDPHAEG